MSKDSRSYQLTNHRTGKKLRYSSPAIKERRRRLLVETRLMIERDGMENFSVLKLCEKAGVAPRTLYNAFGFRERLIAIAICDEINAMRAEHQSDIAPTNLPDFVEGAATLFRLNLRSRNTAAALSAIYFQPNIDRDVWDMIQDVATSRARNWLNITREKGELRAPDCIDRLLGAIAHVQFAAVLDWANNRIDDDEYFICFFENVLMLICSATCGDTESDARRFLGHIQTHNALPSK